MITSAALALTLMVPLQAAASPSDKATADQVDAIVAKLYRLKIFDEEQLVERLPTLEMLSSDKLWLLDYAVDYKQWDGAEIDKMLPKFIEASEGEVRIRMKIAQEDMDRIKRTAQRSEAARKSQLKVAAGGESPVRRLDQLFGDREYPKLEPAFFARSRKSLA